MSEQIEKSGEEGAEEDFELMDSIAYSFIDNVSHSRKITRAEADYLRNKYKSLYDAINTLKKAEAALDKKSRVLSKSIHSDKISVENLRGTEVERGNEIKRMEKHRENSLKDLDWTEQNETRAKFELAELKKQHEELCELLANQKKGNQDLVEPVIDSLKKDISKLQDDIDQCDNNFTKENNQKTALIKKLQEIEELKVSRGEELERVMDENATTLLEPSRLARTGLSMEKATSHMKSEYEALQKRIYSRNSEIEKQYKRKEEAQKLKTNLEDRLELHHRTIEKREEEMSILKKSLENEKYKHHDLITRKVDLNLRKRDIDSDVRHRRDQLLLIQKEYDSLKRFYKKKKLTLDSENRLIPMYQNQLHEEEVRVSQQRVICEKKRVCNAGLKDELDGFISRVVHQEDVEGETKENLERIMSEVEELEAEILLLITEDKRTAKLVSVLSSHRDMKAREGTRVLHKERETRQHVLMKELIVLDLTKRCNEITNRLKEFSALYEVVKNERNKYVNLIQSSAQALAEMREKIRILSSEVDILRSESHVKDQSLFKEKSTHSQSQSQRDTLRQEMNKLLAEYRQKQFIVEQQIQEIDKYNTVINTVEQEMIILKTRNEKCVDERNAIGVQLIDRNDELCILYERSKQQQEILNYGENKLALKEDDLRMLRLQMEELQRQYRVAITHIPEAEKLKNKIKQIELELISERKISEELGCQLEDPNNTSRWRSIDGEDLDGEQLQSKIHYLETMMSKKREQLLQKGLVLEEVVTLTEKLRHQALSRRDAAKCMADHLNNLQTRIREVTKKMLASVSELSMYQATALRLQQEKIRREKEVDEAKWKADHGEAPNPEAVRELHRLERMRTAQLSSMKSTDILSQERPENMFKTTAEPRPTAYIPDEVGIPKPYGMSAPFKPSELGSNMRHIRPPQPKPIEI